MTPPPTFLSNDKFNRPSNPLAALHSILKFLLSCVLSCQKIGVRPKGKVKVKFPVSTASPSSFILVGLVSPTQMDLVWSLG